MRRGGALQVAWEEAEARRVDHLAQAKRLRGEWEERTLGGWRRAAGQFTEDPDAPEPIFPWETPYFWYFRDRLGTTHLDGDIRRDLDHRELVTGVVLYLPEPYWPSESIAMLAWLRYYDAPNTAYHYSVVDLRADPDGAIRVAGYGLPGSATGLRMDRIELGTAAFAAAASDEL